MIFILRRVAIASSIALVAVLFWFRRVDTPRLTEPGRLAVVKGTSPGLEVKITPGKRAYGIRINDVASLAGMVQPNSRVDVMVVIDDPDKAGKRVAKLFMSNMRVLAIGTATPRAEDGRPLNEGVATIEVTPEEAERLATAATQSKIQLVLRGYGDPDSIGATPYAMPNAIPRDLRLRNMPRYTPPGRARPDTLTVKVLRGRTGIDTPFARDSTGRRPRP